VVTKAEMSSRERVMAALNHQEPDRVPIALASHRRRDHDDCYRNLLRHLGWMSGRPT